MAPGSQLSSKSYDDYIYYEYLLQLDSSQQTREPELSASFPNVFVARKSASVPDHLLWNDERVKSAARKSGCAVILTSRIVRKYITPSRYHRYAVLQVIGPTEGAIQLCNRLLERSFQFYRLRQDYARRMPLRNLLHNDELLKMIHQQVATAQHDHKIQEDLKKRSILLYSNKHSSSPKRHQPTSSSCSNLEDPHSIQPSACTSEAYESCRDDEIWLRVESQQNKVAFKNDPGSPPSPKLLEQIKCKRPKLYSRDDCPTSPLSSDKSTRLSRKERMQLSPRNSWRCRSQESLTDQVSFPSHVLGLRSRSSYNSHPDSRHIVQKRRKNTHFGHLLEAAPRSGRYHFQQHEDIFTSPLCENFTNLCEHERRRVDSRCRRHLDKYYQVNNGNATPSTHPALQQVVKTVCRTKDNVVIEINGPAVNINGTDLNLYESRGSQHSPKSLQFTTTHYQVQIQKRSR